MSASENVPPTSSAYCKPTLAALVAGVALVALMQPPPVSAAGVVAITAGHGHTCALTTQGGVKCWGQNGAGQLGDGTTEDSTTPIDVEGLGSGVTAVAAGALHTCALLTNGTVRCWGENEGQLGIGAGGGPLVRTPADVCSDESCTSSLSDITAISAGGQHTCAITASRTVTCWGGNEDGQLGNGTTDDSIVPVDVPGLIDVTAIEAGGSHTCAIVAGGNVFCWGSNGEGQIGDDRACGMRCVAPSPVIGLDGPTAAIAAAGLHTCALSTAGGVFCWGFNFEGQVGDGTSENIRTTATGVSGLATGATAVDANGVFRGHACALTDAGAVLCWGDNTNGQIGDGTTTDRHVPVPVADMASGVSMVTMGEAHACAVLSGKNVRCWGNNASGQLGDGTTTQRATPVAVEGLAVSSGDANCDSDVTSIDAALILQFTARLLASLPCEAAADVNASGRVDAVDAAIVLQLTAGLLESL